MKRLAALAAATTLMAALAGCASDDDATETSPTASREAERIVPLNGDIAEIVYALGLGDEVVGTDVSATYPAEVEEKPRIGYQRQLAAEGILALQPTVVIGTEEAGPPEVIEQLRAAGPEVTILPVDPAVEAVPDKIRAVAEALGVEEAGEELAAQTESSIADAVALAGEAASKPRVAFLYVRGPQTLMIGGAGSRADAMIAAAGGIDAGTETGVQGFKPLTPEALAAAQPDVLLLLSAGLESIGGTAGLAQLPGVAQTDAGKQGRVLAYDDLLLLGGGPRTGDALTELVKGLHPELATS
ncbi:MAG: heme/hemin ABC transporter substrate-binding protein [Jiangellaceae bacterium]